MDRDSGSGFFAGLIMGALVGVVVGFLYAPQEGKETRRLVKEKAGLVKERASKVASRVRDVVQDRMEKEEE
ncbi:MAG: YtxH domain-containing protein [Chloroflexi bacterium]|nr:YtxH domain-containing protein [Chloroflexota bacterium]